MDLLGQCFEAEESFEEAKKSYEAALGLDALCGTTRFFALDLSLPLLSIRAHRGGLYCSDGGFTLDTTGSGILATFDVPRIFFPK